MSIETQSQYRSAISLATEIRDVMCRYFPVEHEIAGELVCAANYFVTQEDLEEEVDFVMVIAGEIYDCWKMLSERGFNLAAIKDFIRAYINVGL